MPSNEKDIVVFDQPTSVPQRRSVASQCCTRMKLSIPCVVDTIENSVDDAYAGWPERIFIVDGDGRIAYAGKQGPWGFKVEEAEAWLRAAAPVRRGR